MNAYEVRHATTLPLLAAGAVLLILSGFLLARLPARRVASSLSWLLAAGAVTAAHRITIDEPAGTRMLGIITLLFLGMKGVVHQAHAAAGGSPLSPGQWLVFATLWPGMRPALFRSFPGRRRAGWFRLATAGIRNLVAGIALLFLARAGWHPPGTGHVLAATALALTGISLALHFGLLNLSAGVGRLAGAACNELFQAPLFSRSLSEFWGKRWNLAFCEMTALTVYRPLRGVTGPGAALLVSFLLSGLLHETAISLPVRRGYGFPLVYFLVQGLVVLAEGGMRRSGHRVEEWGWAGRLWTALWLLVPIPLLFHPFFLEGVVWPLLGHSIG